MCKWPCWTNFHYYFLSWKCLQLCLMWGREIESAIMKSVFIAEKVTSWLPEAAERRGQGLCRPAGGCVRCMEPLDQKKVAQISQSLFDFCFKLHCQPHNCLDSYCIWKMFCKRCFWASMIVLFPGLLQPYTFRTSLMEDFFHGLGKGINWWFPEWLKYNIYCVLISIGITSAPPQIVRL